LRPVNIACRVGEHNAVVWKRFSFNPPAANRSATGVLQGPPNVDAPAKPTSSSSAIRMFGAPAGGRRIVIGG
jgi:hypothetical protein